MTPRLMLVIVTVLFIGVGVAGPVSAAAPLQSAGTPTDGVTPPGEDDGDDGPNVCEFFDVYEREIGFPGHTREISVNIERLFSRDSDIEVDTSRDDWESRLQEAYSEQCGDDIMNDEEKRAIMADMMSNQPLTTPSGFNSNGFGAIPTTGAENSLVPTGVETTNSTVISDAFVLIYSVMPSTTLIESSRSRTVYVPPTTEIARYHDYRLALPADDTSGPVQYSYEVRSHGVVSNCIRLDGATDRGCEGATRRVAGQKASPRLSMENVSSISAIVSIEARVANHSRECPDWNTSSSRCEGRWETDTTTITDSVTVSATRESVRVAQEPNVTVRAARFPNGTYQVHIELHNRFSMLQLRNQNHVFTPYRFLTYTDPIWDEVRVRGPGSFDGTHPRFHPLRVYAFPVSTGSAYRNTTNDESLNYAASEIGRLQRVVPGDRRYHITPRAIPSTVDVPIQNGSYTYPNEIWIRDIPEFDPTEMEATGLFPEVSAAVGDESDLESPDGITLEYLKDVTSPQLFAREVADLKGPNGYEVVLRDSDGHPINTTNRSGYITVLDRRINTSNGTATIRVEDSKYFTVEYHPQAWYANSSQRAFVSTGYTHAPKPDGGVMMLAVLGIEFGITLLLPSLLAIYMVDQIPGVSAWPPWKLIKQ